MAATSTLGGGAIPASSSTGERNRCRTIRCAAPSSGGRASRTTSSQKTRIMPATQRPHMITAAAESRMGQSLPKRGAEGASAVCSAILMAWLRQIIQRAMPSRTSPSA